MTARITDRLRTWWIGLDNVVWHARLRLRIVTSRADTDDTVQWAAGEFRRLGQAYLANVLVREMAARRRAKADAEALVRSLRLPYDLPDGMAQELLSLRDALRGKPVDLADVDPGDVVAAAEDLLRNEKRGGGV